MPDEPVPAALDDDELDDELDDDESVEDFVALEDVPADDPDPVESVL